MQALPDLLERDLRVVFCGINPGVCAAATGHHFAGRSNRFWRVLHLAGFTAELVSAEDDRTLLGYGCGITAVVDRPTARADEVARSEFIQASAGFLEKMEAHRPKHLAFLGKVAFSAVFHQRHVAWGRQGVRAGNSSIWVLPNPSGLNRSFSLDDLVAAYRALQAAVCQEEGIGRIAACTSAITGTMGRNTL